MSRLKLKKFRVQKPDDQYLTHYVYKYSGSELYHEIDDIPTHSSAYLFENENPLVIDLGCGRGEFVTDQARQNPDLNFVGMDVHQKSIWWGVHLAIKGNLENIRFILADMRRIITKYPDASAQTIYLLFPPPHMQYKRLKKDVLTSEMIQEIHRILKPSGEFIFVTDNEQYFEIKRKLINEQNIFTEAETSRGFEGGITRFQKFWEKFGIPSVRIRYVKK